MVVVVVVVVFDELKQQQQLQPQKYKIEFLVRFAIFSFSLLSSCKYFVCDIDSIDVVCVLTHVCCCHKAEQQQPQQPQLIIVSMTMRVTFQF